MHVYGRQQVEWYDRDEEGSMGLMRKSLADSPRREKHPFATLEERRSPKLYSLAL